MTNEQLEARLAYLVRYERRITREILELICEVEKRKFYLEQAYPSIYEWLIRKYGYSQSAANRRIQAARLLREFPQVKEKIESGALNLSTVTQLQTTLRKEERRSGEKIPATTKQELLTQIENRSVEQTEKILRTQFPEASMQYESLRTVGHDHAKLTIIIEDQTAECLQRARELLSHSCQTWAEVINWLVKDYLKRKDPMLKK